MSDEAIRRKLLADGEGSGDDRRFQQFHRTLLKWMNEPNRPPEEEDNVLRRLHSLLDQAALVVTKNGIVGRMNDEQIRLYDDLFHLLGRQIEDAKVRLVQCKEELRDAKQIRKHRQEYDLMAQLIEEQPARKETIAQLEALKKEIKENEEAKQKLDEKLELRKKQFHVLLISLQELQRLLSEDDGPTVEEAPNEDAAMETT